MMVSIGGKKKNYWYLSIISVALVLVGWAYGTMSGYIHPLFLPTPTRLAEGVYQLWTRGVLDSTLIMHVLASVQRVLAGFALALALGIILGIGMGWYAPIRAIFNPLIEAVRPIPPLAYIPLFILWLGIGEESKVTVIALSTFFPILINTYSAFATVNPIHLKAAATLGASDRRIFFDIVLPSTLPMILAGMRIGLGAAWTTLVASELIAAVRGLGTIITLGRRYLRPDYMLAAMAFIGIMAKLMDVALRGVSKRLAPWTRQ